MPPSERPSLVTRVRAGAYSLYRGIRRRSDVEAEMAEEFRVHIEMRTEDLVREGLPADEAARRAHLEFGHVERHRDAARASRGLAWVDQIRFSWIDVKLGFRMMAKHPGLTAAAVFALGVGIPVGLAPAHLSRALDAPLPEDSDNRIRAIRYWNPSIGTIALPTHWELDFLRDELISFDQLAAYSSASYSVGSEDGRAASVTGGEVTSSAFIMLGTAPLLGRTLDAGDEVPGSADVVVISQDLWQALFTGDPGIVGRTVRVGRRPHTVVGVMPAGFRFPVNDQIWIPLRDEPASDPGLGRPLRIIGRLAPGVTNDAAQAELSTVRLPSAHPALHGRTPLQLEVTPFAYAYAGLPRGGLEALPEFQFLRLLAFVLLFVACANVAMLLFARTATRFRELAVRTALGASRWRIVSQVFVETLVLAVVAAGAGLFLIDQVVARVQWAAIAGEVALPYWLDLGVTAQAIPGAVVVAVLSATVAGVVPALRITGADVQQSMRSVEAGRSGIRFGGGTGALIVADVAVAVAVVGLAVGIVRHMTAAANTEALLGIAAEEFLSVELRLSANDRLDADRSGEGSAERLATLQQQLTDRLAAEPQVRAVVFADALPRMEFRSRPAMVEGAEPPDGSDGRWVRVATVDVDFFGALEQPILNGRDFNHADVEEETFPLIVNSVFVDELLGGGDPIGRRVRLTPLATDRDAPWHEIVGVVGHLGMNIVSPAGDPGVYLPAPPGGIHPVRVGIRVGPSRETFVPRLREIVAETDPTAILGTPIALNRVYQGDWYLMMGMTGGLGLLVGILVALAASGLYAMMSFSVSERTREIGIRSALGASRPELVLTIMRRSLTQLGVGALIGVPLAAWLLVQMADRNADGTVIGLIACVIPTRRALRIMPTEAFRSEF